jgi:hypothetical protein
VHNHSYAVVGRQSLEHKDFIGKVLVNKELNCQRALKIGLGQLREASVVSGRPAKLPQSEVYFPAWGWLSQRISRDEKWRNPSYHCQGSGKLPTRLQRFLEAWNEFFGIVGA